MVRANVPDAGEVGFNMTPMIDCTFQLIIFFMLASQVANDAYAKNVQIARPTESQSVPVLDYNVPNKVTINVVSADPLEEKRKDNPLLVSSAGFYKIAQDKFNVGDFDRMVEVIKNARDRAVAAGHVKEGDPAREFYIEIRADKRVNWQDVAPAIRAGVDAGVRKMNLTALTEQKGVRK